MGVTRTDIYTSNQNDLAVVAKVLGHPARIAILEFISKSEGCICNDIVNSIGLAQATISQHLKELKSVGLIQGDIEGNSICYCINPVKWNEIQQMLVQFFNNGKKNINCC
ncbi:MAG: ArsR/SmtB family transcription factor [Bacteroidia bacterium]